MLNKTKRRLIREMADGLIKPYHFMHYKPCTKEGYTVRQCIVEAYDRPGEPLNNWVEPMARVMLTFAFPFTFFLVGVLSHIFPDVEVGVSLAVIFFFWLVALVRVSYLTAIETRREKLVETFLDDCTGLHLCWNLFSADSPDTDDTKAKILKKNAKSSFEDYERVEGNVYGFINAFCESVLVYWAYRVRKLERSKVLPDSPEKADMMQRLRSSQELFITFGYTTEAPWDRYFSEADKLFAAAPPAKPIGTKT